MLFQTYAIVAGVTSAVFWFSTWDHQPYRIGAAIVWTAATFIVARWQHRRIARCSERNAYHQGTSDGYKKGANDAFTAVEHRLR